MWIIQTPQCFKYSVAYEAYSKLIDMYASGRDDGLYVTDDAMVVEHFTDTKVKLVHGSYDNIKITTPSDLIIGQAILV